MSDTLTELRDIAEGPREAFRESLWRCFILSLLAGLTLLACRLFHDVDTKTEPGVIMNLPDSLGKYIGLCHSGFQDMIVPFPQTASIAALWFRCYGIVADMIYLDASHEEEDVYQDLCNYWEIVANNGVLFGDDYSWDGVRLAVERFAKEERRQVLFVADKWILRKEA